MADRIFIDLRNWFPSGITGVGQVARNATLAMLRAAPRQEFVLAAHPAVLDLISAPNVVAHPVAIGLGDHPRTEWFEQVEVPRLLKRYAASTYLSYENRVPLLGKAVRATWIHDASIVRFPAGHPARYTALMRMHLAMCRAKADIVFVPSDFSAQECAECFGIQPERIHVAPLGDSELPDSPPQVRAPILLAVGATNPRKNLAKLLQAFARIRNPFPSAILRITGSPREWGRLQAMGLVIPPGVEFLGHLSDEGLALQYQSCCGMVFPSLYEGFGIPLLDSARFGVPVAIADIPPFRAILGHSGLWFSPQDEEGMATAMTRLLAGDSQGSPVLTGEFSWHHCATAMLKVMGRING